MDWNTIISSVIAAIITGLITGVFTVIGVIITNKYNENRLNKKEKEKQNVDKPYFSVKKGIVRSEKDIDINAIATTFQIARDEKDELLFIYDEKILNNNEWESKDFVFENIGNNSAIDFYIAVSKPKNNAIFRADMINVYVDNHLLNYSIRDEQSIINSGQRVVMRINYLKEMENNIGYFYIIYRDTYGNIWEQIFHDFKCLIEPAHEIDSKDYNDTIFTRTALECFKKPWLW
ncbi:MAG: hypothetical protein IJ220_01625 [Clostridia bacterium]|nr:hypothetical protein [Clostridia bacterium]